MEAYAFSFSTEALCIVQGKHEREVPKEAEKWKINITITWKGNDRKCQMLLTSSFFGGNAVKGKLLNQAKR